MNKKTSFLVLTLVVFGMTASLTLAKNAKSDEKSNNSSKSEKQVVKDIKEDKTVAPKQNEEKMKTNNAGEDKNLKNANMEAEESSMDESKVKSDKSKKIEASSKKITKTLKQIASEEEAIGEDLNKLASDQEKTQGKIVNSVKKLEVKNKVKTFLLGTDYKNLGQLRSEMVQNRNQIRKLTQLISQTEEVENKVALQEQLMLMTQDRDQISNIIKENEETFSLFGWAFRLINGYEKQDAVDNAEEQELKTEVKEALDSYDENTEMLNSEDGTEEAGETEEAEDLAPVI